MKDVSHQEPILDTFHEEFNGTIRFASSAYFFAIHLSTPQGPLSKFAISPQDLHHHFHHHQQVSVAHDRFTPKTARHLSRSCAYEAALSTEPICALIMLEYVVGDRPLIPFTRASPRRMSCLRFQASVLEVLSRKTPTNRQN